MIELNQIFKLWAFCGNHGDWGGCHRLFKPSKTCIAKKMLKYTEKIGMCYLRNLN